MRSLGALHLGAGASPRRLTSRGSGARAGRTCVNRGCTQAGCGIWTRGRSPEQPAEGKAAALEGVNAGLAAVRAPRE